MPGAATPQPPQYNVRVISWNCAGWNSRDNERTGDNALQALIEAHQPAIVLIQETFLRPDDPSPVLPGYTVYRADRRQARRNPDTVRGGGLLTLVHTSLRSSTETQLAFTEDNATAYDISRRFLVPAITHQTRVTERSEILEGLASGRYRAVVTSKVLNEGVDVPDANVAIIVSGSGSVREHVQRLGRVLRKVGDKRAVLYELVTADTHETFTSERRREHSAYR